MATPRPTIYIPRDVELWMKLSENRNRKQWYKVYPV